MSNKENCEPEDNHGIFRERMYHGEGIYYHFYYGSDEDTDDASETALLNDEEEFTEMKERMYRDKLAELKNQLNQLNNFKHPAYLKGAKKLEEEFNDRRFKNKISFEVECERIRRDHELEVEAAQNEFNERKKELEETLIADLEEKKKMYEIERDLMDIASDNLEVFHNPIRKLRRRINDPLPAPETKRRKPSPNSKQINLQLNQDEINEDLCKICEVLIDRSAEEQNDSEGPLEEKSNLSDIRVENGKLYYEKYWYHRGQQIYYEGKDVGYRNSAVIATINPTEVWVKRTYDNEKYQIFVSELVKGAITLKRRSA